MVVLQIIYLAVNLVGIGAGLIYFVSGAECSIFSDLFTFIRKYFKKVGVIITAILLIGLLLPTITFMSALIAFVMLYGTYAE
jgi:Na+-transporting NADH:ubiquinone oxidoreductase subunit NqrB